MMKEVGDIVQLSENNGVFELVYISIINAVSIPPSL